MQEFFMGWRRKVGCVLLVMAATVTGIWIRSTIIDDFVDFNDFIDYPIANDSLAGIKTEPHFFVLTKYTNYKRTDLVNNQRKQATATVSMMPFFRIPFWTTAIPMTLLSAYLILWPGKRKPANSRAEAANSLS